MPIDKIMQTVNANPGLKGAMGGAAGGALVSAMLGNKTARKVAKTGGLMALGGLAWQAYRSYQDSTTQNSPDQVQELPKEAFDLNPESASEDIDLVVRAMIAAAHADGQLDDNERHRIWDHALTSGFSTSQLEALSQEINHPVGIAQLAVMANGLEQKIEIYTASRLLINEEHERGAVYLRGLADALGLPRGLVLALNDETRALSEAELSQGDNVAA